MNNQSTPDSNPSPSKDMNNANTLYSESTPTDRNNTNTPEFRFPLPSPAPQQEQFFTTSSSPETYLQNPRKKRSKMMKIDSSPVVASSSNSSSVVKPKYGKRPDPGAPKIARPCSECGKKFWSWKALFGHMRCHPERQWRGINPPPHFRRQQVAPVVRPASDGVKVIMMSEDDHEIATCLLMLANGTGRASAVDTVQCETSKQQGMVESATANCGDVGEGEEGPSSTGNSGFQCSSCKKVFASHQALGGHRASHKNVKGCFAITRNDDGEDENHYYNGGHGEERKGEGEVNENENGDGKMGMVLGHRCSICLRLFSSGQALGGHKRCHWEKGEEPSPSSLTQGMNSSATATTTKEGCGLDLNLPPPLEDESSSSYSSGLTLELRLGL